MTLIESSLVELHMGILWSNCLSMVVKFGWGITKEEVDNQIAACEILDHNKVRVPMVYRYFSGYVPGLEASRPKDFLVMEYIDGSIRLAPGKYELERLDLQVKFLATFARD